MVLLQPEEMTRIKRLREEQAIKLAMQSRWEDAVAVNQSIIDLFPKDVDSYNRLGKALNELGRYLVARVAYGRALELDPSSSIARRNYQRLATLKDTVASAEALSSAKVDPRLFIEERGKTTIAVLQRPATREVLAKVTAGDRVSIRQNGRSLRVETAGGDYLGMIESKLGLRVIKMMEGGNKYAVAVTNVQDSTTRIIIKEVFQSPSMVGQLSFPSTADIGVRPYTRESLLKYGYEEEEEYADENDDGWDEDGRRNTWTNETDEFGGDEVSPLPEDDDSDDNDEE